MTLPRDVQPAAMAHAAVPAAPVDVLLASSRDEEAVARLRPSAKSLASHLLGPATALAWEREREVAVDVLYYAATAVLGERR